MPHILIHIHSTQPQRRNKTHTTDFISLTNSFFFAFIHISYFVIFGAVYIEWTNKGKQRAFAGSSLYHQNVIIISNKRLTKKQQLIFFIVDFFAMCGKQWQQKWMHNICFNNKKVLFCRFLLSFYSSFKCFGVMFLTPKSQKFFPVFSIRLQRNSLWNEKLFELSN